MKSALLFMALWWAGIKLLDVLPSLPLLAAMAALLVVPLWWLLRAAIRLFDSPAR
jgi:hypothetical protein